MARQPPAAGKARLYPTTRDGQPLLTNWLNNHRLDAYLGDAPRPPTKPGSSP